MSNNLRQRVRQEITRIAGKLKSLDFGFVEHSAFSDDGDIASTSKTTTPVAQGLVAHQVTDIVGQCHSCDKFVTEKMITSCERCSHVICVPCAKLWGDSEKTVCPDCLAHLKLRQRLLVAKKFLLHPFVGPIK